MEFLCAMLWPLLAFYTVTHLGLRWICQHSKCCACNKWFYDRLMYRCPHCKTCLTRKRFRS